MLWGACGQIYRPVVLPCTGNSGLPGCPVEPPPVPSSFHAVFGVYSNEPNGITASTSNFGGALQIDVAGDSIIAETPTAAANFGANPTHAALSPANNRMFVASAGSVLGGTDLVAAFGTVPATTALVGFSPISAIGLPTPSTGITSISEAGNVVTVDLSSPLTNALAGYTGVISLVQIPNCTPPSCNPNAYDGAFTILSVSPTTIMFTNLATGLPPLSGTQLTGATAAFPPQPVFLAGTQNSTMFVANYNANSVSMINTITNFVSNTTNPGVVGVNPVSMVEIPNSQKLYVANQGSNNINTLNTTTLAGNTLTGFVSGFTGVTPAWMAGRDDSQKIYVLTQGDGQLVTIDVASDTVTGSISVGAGANFIFYDPNLNRLYVTNPVTGLVNVFSDSGGVSSTGAPNDTPSLLTSLTIPGLNAGTTPACPSCSAPAPVSVTALANGSRFYVASYQIATPCPDPNVPPTSTTNSCVIPELTIYNANSLGLQYPSTPIMTLLTWSPAGQPAGPFATNQFAVYPVTACTMSTPYTPTTTRFRMFTTAAADSSHVYVSMCDAGVIADILTSGNNANNPGSGTPADTLVTDLPAAFSNGPIQPSTGFPPMQNPIFMLTGQ
jgi:DNA-binding beta-propeller fold protein YncE